MFNFYGDIDYPILSEPAKECHVVVTSSKILNRDFADNFYKYGKLDIAKAYNINTKWDWLNSNAGNLTDNALNRMIMYQDNYPNTIFLCEQKVIDELIKRGIRNKYTNWHVVDSDELSQRLCELFPNKFNRTEGYIAPFI